MSRKNESLRELRTTKKGTTYWYYPETVARRTEKVKEELKELRKEHKTPTSEKAYNSIKTSVNVIKLDSKTDEHYLRYIQKKIKLREEYGRWSKLKRSEWLEYYRRMTDLLFKDEDFQHYFRESKKLFAEKVLDMTYKKKEDKEEEYDGRSDDYRW